MKTLLRPFLFLFLFSDEESRRKRRENHIGCSFSLLDRQNAPSLFPSKASEQVLWLMPSSLFLVLNQIQFICVRYVFTSIYVLGTIGSILNIILFSSKKLRSSSCCFCKKNPSFLLSPRWKLIVLILFSSDHRFPLFSDLDIGFPSVLSYSSDLCSFSHSIVVVYDHLLSNARLFRSTLCHDVSMVIDIGLSRSMLSIV